VSRYFAIFTLVVLLAAAVAARYVKGVDVSQAVPLSAAHCMRAQGYSWATVRCYQSLGNIDPNCAHSVRNFRKAGFAHVDVYIFPCQSCGGGGSEVSEVVDHIKAEKIKVDRIWLDIEGNYWSGSYNANSGFIANMISRGHHLGVELGLYTSRSQYLPIVGGYSGARSLPLWYAHYDYSASLNDFSSFNGWRKPADKQYIGNTYVCGVGADVNIAEPSLFRTSSAPNPAPKHKPAPIPAPKPKPPKRAPLPAPKPKPDPKTFEIGRKIEITASDVNCRSGAGTTHGVVSVWYENDTTHIIAGPKHADGYVWWKTSKNCWSVQEFMKLI